MSSDATPTPRRPWYKTWWIWAIIILTLGAIGYIAEPTEPKPTAPTATEAAPVEETEPAPVKKTKPAPVKKTKPAATEEDTDKPQCVNADALTAALLEYENADTWDDVDSQSPGSWITSIETHSCQYVRVHTDRPLDDTGIDQLARYMYGPGCMVHPDPYQVIITVQGVDHNALGSEYMAICKANRP